MAKKILIIDDEPQIVLMVKTRLKANGYDVLGAVSGLEGVKIAGQEKPDLIFLDYVMPEINGCEVLKALKSDPETFRIPVVMLTANMRGEDVQRYKLDGAADCLFKPFTPNDLLNHAKKFLGEQI